MLTGTGIKELMTVLEGLEQISHLADLSEEVEAYAEKAQGNVVRAWLKVLVERMCRAHDFDLQELCDYIAGEREQKQEPPAPEPEPEPERIIIKGLIL